MSAGIKIFFLKLSLTTAAVTGGEGQDYSHKCKAYKFDSVLNVVIVAPSVMSLSHEADELLYRKCKTV